MKFIFTFLSMAKFLVPILLPNFRVSFFNEYLSPKVSTFDAFGKGIKEIILPLQLLKTNFFFAKK